MDRSLNPRNIGTTTNGDITAGPSLRPELETEPELLVTVNDDHVVPVGLPTATTTQATASDDEGATETTPLIAQNPKINWSAFKIASGVASVGLAMGLSALAGGTLLLGVYGAVNHFRLDENSNLPQRELAILRRHSQLDSTALSTGVKAVSLAVSAGIATITVMFIGGTSTNLTFTMALAGSNMFIQELLRYYGVNVPHNLASRAHSIFGNIGQTLEEKFLLKIFRRALDNAAPSVYPVPREPREAVLRGELQETGVNYVAGAISLFLALAIAPSSGALEALSIGGAGFTVLSLPMHAYLHMMRRLMIEETKERLTQRGVTNPEEMATELVMRTAFLPTRNGDILADIAVFSSRLLGVAKYVPLGLLAAALPSSASRIIQTIVGASAAAASVNLAYTVRAIGDRTIRPEDINNNVIDNSPVTKIVRTIVYGAFILFSTVLAPYLAVLGTVGSSSIVNLSFAIGGIAWMSLALTLTYLNLNRIDDAVLRVLPCAAHSNACKIFLGNSEGVTDAELATRVRADEMIEEFRTQIEQDQSRRRTQNPAPLVSSRVDLNLDNIGNTHLEVISRDAEGWLRCIVIQPPQDPTNPNHIRDILIDSHNDGHLRIQYNNGQSVELIGGVQQNTPITREGAVHPTITELSSSRSSGSSIVEMSGPRIQSIAVIGDRHIQSVTRSASGATLTQISRLCSDTASFVSADSSYSRYDTAQEEVSQRSDSSASDNAAPDTSSSNSGSGASNTLSTDSFGNQNYTHEFQMLLPKTLELLISEDNFGQENEISLFNEGENTIGEEKFASVGYSEENEGKEHQKYDIDGNYIMRPNETSRQNKFEEESGFSRYDKTIYPEAEYFSEEREETTRSGWFNYGNDPLGTNIITPVIGVVMFGFQQHAVSNL